MKSYVSLERAKSTDKDYLIDTAFKKFNRQNVDKNGNYVKYSDLENNFDGTTQMYEGLQQLEDGLIDYIEIIQTVKSIFKNNVKSTILFFPILFHKCLSYFLNLILKNQ